MSSPVQSLHLQAAMLRFQHVPGPRLVRRILSAVFWPFTKLYKLYRRRTTAPPRPLKPRKRSLSLSRPSSLGGVRKTVFQTDSALLSKLPLELRQIVWKECLGGMTLHLKVQDRHLRGRCCTENEVPDPCWEFFGLVYHDKVKKKLDRRELLAILLTCRQVYSEAIDYLYSENVFDSLFFEAFLYLPRCILPQRLNSIRSLYFLWYLEAPPLFTGNPREHLHHRYDKAVWDTMWQNLSMMKGLTELGIQLYIDPVYHPWWTIAELELLQATNTVTAPKTFDLYLPFPTAAKESELTQFPCKVSHMD